MLQKLLNDVITWLQINIIHDQQLQPLEIFCDCNYLLSAANKPAR